MASIINNLAILLGFLVITNAIAVKKGGLGSRGLKQIITGAIDCLLYEEEELNFDDNVRTSRVSKWYCEDENEEYFRIVYKIDSNFFKHKDIVSGSTHLKISNVTRVKDSGDQDEDRVIIGPGSKVEIVNHARYKRSVVPFVGINTIIVIRATSEDGGPKSAAELSDDIFGIGEDKVNLVSQYEGCSGGKFRIVPAKGKHIEGGVLTVNVRRKFKRLRVEVVNKLVKEAAEAVVGPMTQWTQYMVVVQNNVKLNAAAVAQNGGPRSTFKSNYVSSVLVQVHEIGHNLGMGHSGEITHNEQKYNDHTCMMGNPLYADEAPKMCFNGAKSWHLTWYEDRQITVEPTRHPWRGNLVGINDYLKGQTIHGRHFVLVQIKNTMSDEDLYVMYNRKEGPNEDVIEFPDKVTIVKGDNNGIKSMQSWLLAGLGSGDTYRHGRFSDNFDLVIEVCNLVEGHPDFADVIIYMENGRNDLSCSSSPTTSPTRSPISHPLYDVNQYVKSPKKPSTKPPKRTYVKPPKKPSTKPPKGPYTKLQHTKKPAQS